MSAFIIARVDVKDWDRYREYTRHTPRVIAKFGGRFIARGGETVTLEGDAEGLRVVLIEFPSLEQAKVFYRSDEYTQIRKLREGAGDAKIVAISGYAAADWDKALDESRKLG